MEARPVPVCLDAFKAAHPDVDVRGPLDTRTPFWKAYRDGEQLAVEHNLRLLLDALERRLGDPSG